VLRAAGGFTAGESVHRVLLDAGQPLPRTLRLHASKRRLVRAQLRLNPPRLMTLTEDKEVFARVAAQRGLPVPRQIAIIGGREAGVDPARDRRRWEQALASCDAGAIVVKPAEGFLGRGVRVLRLEGDRLVDARGLSRTPAEVYAELREDGRRYVAQERLTDHPGLQAINTSNALQTVRFTMLLDHRPDAILFSWLKLAPRAAEVDNYFHGLTGTVYADVHPEHGRVRGLWAPRPGAVGSDWVARHPVTGADLTGVTVPLWDEARGLADRASRLFLPMRTIGWDVAITRDGPVLIEGNARWDPPPVGSDSGALLRRLRAARATVT
jgi:hypothetical protein